MFKTVLEDHWGYQGRQLTSNAIVDIQQTLIPVRSSSCNNQFEGQHKQWTAQARPGASSLCPCTVPCEFLVWCFGSSLLPPVLLHIEETKNLLSRGHKSKPVEPGFFCSLHYNSATALLKQHLEKILSPALPV